MTQRYPLRIISGGQTGVDRAALDAAIARGIEHGGWCPRGRRSEDGTIPQKYALIETESPQYHLRTRRNVVESDATLILHRGKLTGGTALTKQLAQKHGRPCLVVDLDQHVIPHVVWEWIDEGRFETVNVAGPRESTEQGVGEAALAFLLRVLSCREDEAPD